MSKTADNFFSCKETPVSFPSGLKASSIYESPSSTLRIISQIPGPGNYTGPFDFFFDINENPTTSIHFNGFMYNLSKSYLCIPGVHKIAGETKVCDAEIVIVFNPSQSSSTEKRPIMLCIPVESGIRINPQSQKYFATLGTGVTANRPTFGSILQPKSTFITYNGFNFLLRLSTTNILKSCSDIPDSPTNNVRYLVCQNSIGMTVSDFDRFNGRLARKPRPVGANDYAPLEQLVKPPKAVDEPSSARIMELTTLITNVTIQAGDAIATPACPSNFMGIPTKSMKCKPLRPGARGLRVDMNKNSVTLDKELAKTKDALNEMDLGRLDPGINQSATTYFQPGDIERAISVFFGIMGGLVICAIVGFLVQRFVFTGYVSVIEHKEAAALKLPPLKMPKASFPDIPKMLCPKD
jgi:hypothetical protein